MLRPSFRRRGAEQRKRAIHEIATLFRRSTSLTRQLTRPRDRAMTRHMGTIRVHAASEYITLINHFTVAPKDQLGVARVQLGDMYWYGKQQPAAISANFHRSVDGERFFNYAQWRSEEGLVQARETPDFKTHVSNYRYFDMKGDPRIYEVVWTSGGRKLQIVWRGQTITTLRVFSVRSEDQAEVLRIVRGSLEKLEGSKGLVGVALHRGLDGQRVAVYAQWRDVCAAFGREQLEAEVALARFNLTSDFRTYEVVGTTDDEADAGLLAP
jgi:quinol monooxygenase YgiN